MSAVRLQTELKEALDACEPPALSVISDNFQVPAPAPAIRREIDEILAGCGKLSADAVGRLKERAARTGEDLISAARRLGLATQADLEIARAIRDGVLQDDPSAFGLGAELAVIRRPNSATAEEYRGLRARLVTTQPMTKLRSVCVIPAGADVQAEIAAANIAVAFAQIGKRVLLIDGDLRRPRLGRLMAAAVPQRLCDAVAIEEAQRATAVEGVFLLAGREPSPRPQEFLASARFSAMIQRARAEFDVVLALTAPFGPAADGQFIWAEAKSALVAARRDHTRADELRGLQATLRQVGAEIIGSIILA